MVDCTLGKQAEPHINSTQRPLADILKQAAAAAGQRTAGGGDAMTDTKQLHTETDYIQHVLEDTMGRRISCTTEINVWMYTVVDSVHSTVETISSSVPPCIFVLVLLLPCLSVFL